MVYTQGIVAKLSIRLKLELPAESITIVNSRGVCTPLLFEIVKVLQKVIWNQFTCLADAQLSELILSFVMQNYMKKKLVFNVT